MLSNKEKKKKHSSSSKSSQGDPEPSISLPFGNPAYTSPGNPAYTPPGNTAYTPPVKPRLESRNKPAVPARKWTKDSLKARTHSISNPVQGSHHQSLTDSPSQTRTENKQLTGSGIYSTGSLSDYEPVDHHPIVRQDQPKNSPPPLPERPKDISPPADSWKTLKLQEAVEKHANDYPFQFRVTQGYCSSTFDVNMSTGDVYAVHSKEETIIAIATSNDGVTHKIPHKTSQKIGVVYDPFNDPENGLSGYTFVTVADLTAATPPPKIVCATREVRTKEGKYLTEPNEILIMTQIKKARFKSKKSATFYSMLTKSEKTLPTDCASHFSTKPSLIQLDLQEIVTRVPDPFPVTAVIYSAGGNIASTVTHGVVTIAGYSKQTSLVVSTSSLEDNLNSLSSDTGDGKDRFHLILDQDTQEMEVQVYDEDEDDCLDSVPTVTKIKEEAHQYNTLSREGRYGPGPGSVDEEGYMDVFHPPTTTFVTNDPTEEYSTIDILNISSSSSSLPLDQPTYDDVLVQNHPSPTTQQRQNTTDQPTQSTPRKTLSQKNHTLVRLQEDVSKLTQRLELVENQLQRVLRTAASQPVRETTKQPNNHSSGTKHSLHNLDVEGVCVLLASLGLGQYRPTVERWCVTGDILAALDDNDLETELQIKSKIHRLRILKIISEHT